MDALAVVTVAIAFLGFGLASRKLEGSVLTGPMIFAGLGFLVGPAMLGLVPVGITNATFHTLAEVTLVLVLFSDAASIDLRQLGKDHNLPVRMLLVGMPLTIALGIVAALMLFPGWSFWEAAILAAVLTPTDAALGQAVISNEKVPLRIRQAVNVESGLNDGIALPFVLIFASLASATTGSTDATEWLVFGAKQVVLGPLAGLLVGYVGAKLVARCYEGEWLAEWAEGIIALALAFAAFALAEVVHGNGFIAAFVAGLVFGHIVQHKCAFLYEFAETEGRFLVLLTFLLFGCAMIPMALFELHYIYIVYALLSLTVLRMVPVGLSLLGTGVKPVTSAFLGWFGPRGLASVLFILLVVEQAEIAHRDEIFIVTITTVALSILLHGMSAGPAARRYGAMTRDMGECEENQPVASALFAQAAEPRPDGAR